MILRPRCAPPGWLCAGAEWHRHPLPTTTPPLTRFPNLAHNPSAGFALALSGITTTYYQPDPDDIKAGGSKWGLIFVGIALGTLLVTTFQVGLVWHDGAVCSLDTHAPMFSWATSCPD